MIEASDGEAEKIQVLHEATNPDLQQKQQIEEHTVIQQVEKPSSANAAGLRRHQWATGGRRERGEKVWG